MGAKLIMLGAPGAGKGTQAGVLSAKLGIPTISTGNILRAAIQEGTAMGLEAKTYMDEGKLVPDDIIIKILVSRLQEPDCQNGYILDGAPRTIGQAEELEKAGIIFDRVLSIEIADETIEQRMEGRRVCIACGTPYHITAHPPKKAGTCDKCGGELIQRNDDKPATVKRRLAVYHAQTEPLKEFYATKGVLKSLENRDSIAMMTTAMLEALEA